MTPLERAKQIAGILDNKKATDVKAIHIGDVTTIGDYFVIATGTSSPQVKALSDEVDKILSAEGLEPKRIEGYNAGTWILMDYSDVIVHIFQQETRDFYSLEKVWVDAPLVELDFEV